MFEYHGWARIESTSGKQEWRPDGLYYPDDTALYERLVENLCQFDATSRETISLRKTVNGLTSLTVSGLRNHRDNRIFDLYEWIAEHGERSTGVLFTSDDEDDARRYNPETQFRVYRLCRGEFVELDELFEMPR